MDDLESGYLNEMMNLAGNEEKFWHYSRKIIQEREQESLQCESIEHFLRFHQAKLIEKLELSENYALVRILMQQIVDAGTMMFSIKMLNELKKP